MVLHRPVAILWIVVTLILLVAMPGISADVVPPTPPTLSVSWYPTGFPVTPYDTVDIRANAASTSGIKNVTIYYRISPWFSFRPNSVSDYNSSSMQGPISGDYYNGTWFYDFLPQKNGTSIFFVILAFDNSGLKVAYPGNQPFSNPQSIQIRFPDEPYLSYVNVYFNTLTISDTATEANISVSMAAYLPSPHEAGWYSVDIFSPPGAYPIGYLSLYESPNSRFFYVGQASWLVYLNSASNEIPYDTYSLSLNLTLPYQFDNLTFATKYYVPQGRASTEVFNSFTVVTSYTPLFSNDNNSVQLIYLTLSRRVPLFYPALVLMLVSLAVLGLVPLVSIYHPAKRFDIFLNVIILSSSAELSATLYPPTGFHGDTIFTESFALILGAAVFMMAVSSLPDKFRVKTIRGIEPEWYTNIGIVALITYFIWLTNFPATAKMLTPFLGLSGLISFGLYRTLPKAVTRLRLILKRIIMKWKKLRRRKK
ncbi:MAG: hypothetical protein ACHQ03_08650 [Candidatus Bathyarchaeia archaeon]